MENDPTPTAAGIANAKGSVPRFERYGRYCLIERIGRGGMAEVFRAVAQGVEGFRRVFVIKRIRPEKSDSVELIRMFCDEARLSALLDHPNIVQVYDFGQINGTYFLAMEYLRGKDLSAVMRAIRRARSAVNPPVAAHIARQVASALYYAHTLTRMNGQVVRIVHRDVTPSNIMLQRNGAVKMLDFGIAQATNFGRQVETGGGRVKGKLAYLSPEQVRLEELDGRSDVFALGVVLWEMLAGQRLFSADSEFLTMRNVLTQPIPAPSSKRPEVPAALDAIVARALQRERDKRYHSAQDMADDLERFLNEVPCHSQAVPRLLHDLFGEELVEATPDFPELAHGDRGDFTLPAATPAPAALRAERSVSSDREESPTDFRASVPARDPDLPWSSGRGDPAGRFAAHRLLARRLVAGAAAATLVACLSWAMWRGKRASSVAKTAAASASGGLAQCAAPSVPIPLVERAPAPAPITRRLK